jgi:hypothetical protein
MGLRLDAQKVMDYGLKQKDKHLHNYQVLDIDEGNLLPYVLDDLKKQLSPKAFESAKHRVSPINFLRKLLDKLSKIYQDGCFREVEEESSFELVEGGADAELVEFYSKEMDINIAMTQSVRYFKAHKCVAIEPYLDLGRPRLRAIPADRFFVYSNDIVNPLRMTHFAKFAGEIDDRKIWHLYTAEEFAIVEENGHVLEVRPNPYGAIPFIYVNKSAIELFPRPDTDLLSMVKLFPVLFTDLNFISMFSSHSVVYGIDVNFDNIELSPNSMWSLKSDLASGKQPQLGIIKPEGDIDKLLSMIAQELSTWLETRNVKAKAVNGAQVDNISGVSKIIDEIDTTEDRKETIPHFIKAELELWNLIANHLHPIWRLEPDFQDGAPRMRFSPGFELNIYFPTPEVAASESEIIDNQIKLIDKGLTTKKAAVMEIHDMTEEEAEKFVDEIEEDSTVELVEDETVEQPSEDVNGDQKREERTV